VYPEIVPVLQSEMLQLVAQPSSSLLGHSLGPQEQTARSALFNSVAAVMPSSIAGAAQSQGRIYEYCW